MVICCGPCGKNKNLAGFKEISLFCLGYYGKALTDTFQGKAPKTILSIKLPLWVLST